MIDAIQPYLGAIFIGSAFALAAFAIYLKTPWSDND